MARSRRLRLSRYYPHFTLLAVLLVGFFIYRSLRPSPETPVVFVVTPLSYGDSTLIGTIRKDAPVGVAGNYLLVLSDGRPIALDSQGIDALIGVKVRADGFLSPPATSTDLPTLQVKTLDPVTN